MEMFQLRYFIAVAEELNMSRAAFRANVSQPALSRAIGNLESELGLPLFTREHNGVRLTPAGQKLFPYARQMISLYDQAINEVKSHRNTAAALSIGFIASFKGNHLVESLGRFRNEYPDVSITLRELSPADQVEELRKLKLDLALLGNPCGSVEDEFAVKTVYTSKLEVVLPLSHPLAGSEQVSLNDLKEEPFIGYDENIFPSRNRFTSEICSSAGFVPRFVNQAKSLPEILTLVGSGAGVTFLTSDAHHLAHINAVFVPIAEILEPIRFAAVWRRNDKRPLLKELLSCFL